MNEYSIALYFHIVSVLGLFVALGLEWTALFQIRAAQDAGQIRTWMGILKNLPKVGTPSMLAAVLTGLYLMWSVWGGTGWLIATIGALVIMIALSLALTGPRMTAIGRALSGLKGPVVSQTFRSLASQPLLWISIQTRIAIALGIVFLKTAKPDLAGSLFTIGVAIVLGVASALSVSRHEQAPVGSAD